MLMTKRSLYHYWAVTVLCLVILALLSFEFLLNLTPPIARDAVIHHLAIPKLWLENGGFYEVKWADFSYFPMNVDLLYMIPLYFNKDFLANFIHMSFGLGTALLIYIYLKNKLNNIAGLLGVLVFLSTPIVIRSSTQAYVDLGLTFFVTASILSFIRYRDGQFKEFRWLFLSSAAMGLALGTKYNALIVWFFLTLSIVFIHSRDTGRQWNAIRSGTIFFLISLIIFSPWLIKNMILAGNPLYPLFKGGAASLVSGNNHIGFFQMREILYGENIWEILLIPVRIFFQGRDNSSQYFDGVLNPILIILSPFALINKSFLRDKLFFFSFTVFFILTVFFLEQKAFSMEAIVRYVLPVIPFLSILAVMGLVYLWNLTNNILLPLRKVMATLIIVFFIALMSINIFYLKNYFQNINPLSYISGKESRDEFITRHAGSYPAIKYVNTHTPETSKIRLIFLAGRGYYLDRIYSESAAYGIGDINALVASAGDEKSFQAYLRSIDCTHLLVRTDLYLNYLRDNYSPEKSNQMLSRISKSTEMMYNANNYVVYRLIPPR